MAEIPCIDIAPFLSGDARTRAAVAKEWGRAFEEIGFVTITGHGVPEDVSARAHDALLRFFDLPLAAKTVWSMPERVKVCGYLPVGIESVARTKGEDPPPDLCEALVFQNFDADAAATLAGRRSAVTGNFYPDQPPDLLAAVQDYFLAVDRLVETIMRLSALALDLPEEFFAPYFAGGHRAILRCVHYPAQPVAPEPGQMRYGPHTDYNAMTLLRQDDAPGGLQARTRSGEWIDVRPVAGSYVVNIGDLMERWTNDRWRSTFHRVVNPPRDLRGPTRRLSLVLFTGPNDESVIETLPTCIDAAHPAKYAPVGAGAYIQQKLEQAMPEKYVTSATAAE